MFFAYQTAALIGGLLLDFIIGDPQWIYHPVRLLGKLISSLERILRRIFPKEREFAAGVVLTVATVIISGAAPAAVALAAYRISPWVYFAAESVMCYFLVAAKSLKTESMRVYEKIAEGDAEGARAAVSMIVGRDTAALDADGIIKAAVETVAENTSDGVTAPVMYMLVGGAALGFMYKAVNTLDSMVGYKNDRYLHFGCAAAKTDDFANFVPARITARIMIFAAMLAGLDYRSAQRIYLRDRNNHASPNSAHTEAVTAGALGVRLAGDAYYFGKLYKKPFIGDDTRPIENEDIKRANRLMYMTAALTAAFGIFIKAALIVFV